MKNKLIIGTIIAIALPLVTLISIASAKSLSTEHLDKIKAGCQQARSIVGQIHTNDAPIYVNSNQTYYSISSRLMAPLNSRLASNGLDINGVSKVISTYNADLNDFRALYKTYDNVMAELVQLDCTKNPEQFYDKVADAREARSDVSDAVDKLSQDLEDFREQVKLVDSDQINAVGDATNE